MKLILSLITVIFLYILPAAGYCSEPVAVIVNRDNRVEGLSQGELRKIYTNNILNWPDGTPIIIYDLSVQDPMRHVFSGKILEKSPDKVAEEWAHLKITNEAKNPPLTLKSEALIIRRVSNEKGAIGYVSLSTVTRNPDVKVVFTIQ